MRAFDLHLPIVFRSPALARAPVDASFTLLTWPPSSNHLELTQFHLSRHSKTPRFGPIFQHVIRTQCEEADMWLFTHCGFHKNLQSLLLACWERTEGTCGRERLMPFKWHLFQPCWETQNTHGPSYTHQLLVGRTFTHSQEILWKPLETKQHWTPMAFSWFCYVFMAADNINTIFCITLETTHTYCIHKLFFHCIKRTCCSGPPHPPHPQWDFYTSGWPLNQTGSAVHLFGHVHLTVLI